MRTFFAFGAVAVTLLATGVASANDTNLPYWALRYRCVHQDLTLTATESQAVDGLVKEAYDVLWQDTNRFPPPNTSQLPREEAIQKMRDFNALNAPRRRKLAAQFDPRFAQLLGAGRVKRLRQVAWQINQRGSLCDPQLQEALGLSDEQRRKIAAFDEEFKNRDEQLFAPFTLSKDSSKGLRDPEAFRAKVDALYSEWSRTLTHVLTGAQKKKLKEILGKPFDSSLIEKERQAANAGGK